MPNWKTYESSVRLLSAIVAAHPGLKLNYDEIVRLYGSDCTKKAFLNHYNRDLLPNIKSLKQAADDGRDPKDVIMVEGARIAGTGKPIAREYGEGVTGDGATPAKVKRGGGGGRGRGKKATAPTNGNGMAGGSGEDDDEEGSFGETPTKPKTPLNKTKTGRVTKPSSGRAKKQVNYNEDDNEDDEESMVKNEVDNGGFMDINYSNGHSGGSASNGSFQDPRFSQGNGYVAETDENETWYAAEDNDEA